MKDRKQKKRSTRVARSIFSTIVVGQLNLKYLSYFRRCDKNNSFERDPAKGKIKKLMFASQS